MARCCSCDKQCTPGSGTAVVRRLSSWSPEDDDFELVDYERLSQDTSFEGAFDPEELAPVPEDVVGFVRDLDPELAAAIEATNRASTSDFRSRGAVEAELAVYVVCHGEHTCIQRRSERPEETGTGAELALS